MIPDPYKKTVRLPVQVVNGELKFFYGGDLPVMNNGTIGDLIIPEFCIPKDYRLSLICKESKKVFLPEGTALMARLGPRSNDPTKKLLKKMDVSPLIDGLFAKIKLESDLWINFKGTKNSEMLDCNCKIPSLPDEDAKSINHAYTLLSEKFETHRRSHTANVFAQVYYQNNPNHWVQIDQRRKQLISEFEYELICLCKSWWFINDQRGKLFGHAATKNPRTMLPCIVSLKTLESFRKTISKVRLNQLTG